MKMAFSSKIAGTRDKIALSHVDVIISLSPKCPGPGQRLRSKGGGDVVVY